MGPDGPRSVPHAAVLVGCETMHDWPHFDPARLARQLSESLAMLDWAVRGTPARWLGVPLTDGGWSVARNLAHLAAYEERLAVPVLEELAAGGDGMATLRGLSRQPRWDDGETATADDVDALLARLAGARTRQAGLCATFDPDAFNAPTCRFWGFREGTAHPPGWVVTKTIQHTWEHGNTPLQALLFAPR
jgi:hypothetical protein